MLGVTRLNVDRLVSGLPIKVDLRELGGSDTVVIFFGADAEGRRDELAKIVTTDELATLTPALDQLDAAEREVRAREGRSA